MKTSKWKIIIFSIINYSLTNIIFYIIYFLGEFIIALLPENKIINFFLYYKGFFASSIMLGLTLCFTFQSFFLDLCFERYDDIRLVKLITGIFFLIFKPQFGQMKNLSSSRSKKSHKLHRIITPIFF